MNNITPQNKVRVVEEDSNVEIKFNLSLLDGTLVEKTAEGEVFSLQIGDGQFLNKLDELLIGLEIGTIAKFNLMPEHAFGDSDASNFQVMPRADFSEDLELKEGTVIGFNTPTGEEYPGTIFKVTDDSVTVDFNHPLTDKILVFEAEIIAILD